MQRTPTKETVKELNSNAIMPNPKRKCGDSSSTEEVLVGGLSLDYLMSMMGSLLDQKLQNLPTKSDLEVINSQVCTLSSRFEDLASENQSLKDQVKSLYAEKERDRQTINWLEDQIKNKNIIFKGIEAQSSVPTAVNKICEDIMKLPASIKVKSAKKIYEKGGKWTVVAEFESADIVEEILRHSRNLIGTTISLERDLNSKKQVNKKALLQLRKNILARSQKHRISVVNDRMRVGVKWFLWNKQNELMCGAIKGEKVIHDLYSGELDHINCNFCELIDTQAQKN